MQDTERVFSFGRTSNLPNPNQYVKMLRGEYSEFAFDEIRAPQFISKWRSEVFQKPNDLEMDLEIGTGNGYHFAHYAAKNPHKLLVGIELKFKPLIQSIRRPLRAGNRNVRLVRFDAKSVEKLFGVGEINNVIIHFPDPWESGPNWKHRLISDNFLKNLSRLQRPGSWVEFKTDSLSYFRWSLERFVRSPYNIEVVTTDLHKSKLVPDNFVTAFEKIFLLKNQSIHYIKASI